MKFRKMIAGMMCAVLGLSLCGCGSSKEISENDDPPASTTYKTVRLSDNGTLDITRKEIGSTPMGEDGTWTIFVYMSGSNLESRAGKASEDIDEMLAASTGKDVRFIVQTGGTEHWCNDDVNAEKLERYEISDGKRKKSAELPLASMADASTLRNFLKWGVENYPAAKMGVVFWGHGKGSLGGVCKDDLFGGDYLSLGEMQSALSEVTASMTDKFEFVGFDACYMGSAETADILATYARYMIGSEELEPLNGWNFTVLGDLLGKDPNADWGEIAKTLCDGFMDDIGDTKEANRVTISVTDLSKVDDVIVKFNGYASDLCEAFKDKNNLNEFEKKLEAAEHFGNENGFNGFSNTADLGDLVKAGGSFSNRADELISAIENAVVYKRNAIDHQNACGLTVCYPFEPSGLAELRKFAEASISPHYLALADIVLRSASPAADMSAYDKSTIADIWCGDKNNGSRGLYDYWSSAPDPEQNRDESGKSTLVKLTDKFKIEHNGTYNISLNPETLQNIASVGISVYSRQPKNRYNGLGTKLCANADWRTGTFSDTFDGKWYMLPNREPLEVKLCETNNGVSVYDAQITSSEKETTLTFAHDTKKGSIEVDGYLKIGENGSSVYSSLNIGDTISAFYDVYTHFNDKFDTEAGTEYMFAETPAVLYDTLSDGSYYYMIDITDILGDKLQSEVVDFSIKNGKLDFSKPTEESN